MWRRELTTITTKKLFGAVVAAGLVIALSGCGSAPEPATSESAAAGGAVDGFKPCMVSDAGGFDDKSFNQLGFEGLEAASEELGRRVRRRPVRLGGRLRSEHHQPGRPELHAHHHGGLRTRFCRR
jgi:hypothetical protein